MLSFHPLWEISINNAKGATVSLLELFQEISPYLERQATVNLSVSIDENKMQYCGLSGKAQGSFKIDSKGN